MSKVKKTVTVNQTRDADTKIVYQVVAAKNTTDPKIGKVLSEGEVQSLIGAGVVVIIK